MQPDDEAEQYPLKPDTEGPLHSIFHQRASQHVRELWKEYYENPTLDGTKIVELQRVLKKKRSHMVPSAVHMAGPSSKQENKGKKRAGSSGAGSSAPKNKRARTVLWRGLEIAADGDVIYKCQNDGCPMNGVSPFRWRKWDAKELQNGLAHGEEYHGRKWGGLHLYGGKFMCGMCNRDRS